MIKRFKKGFTIVELVIVIAVIAVLAAVLIPTFSNAIKQANESAALQEVKQAYIATVANDISSGDESKWQVYNYGSDIIVKHDRTGVFILIDEDGGASVLKEDKTITHVLKNGLLEKFDASSCQHIEETIPSKAATCTESGLTEGKKCSICGDILVAQQEVPASHTEVVIPGKAATCTQTGLTIGKKCSVCDEITVPQEEIAKKDHTISVKVEKPATCTKPGYSSSEKCTSCGEVIKAEEVINATGHSYVNGVCECGAVEETDHEHVEVYTDNGDGKHTIKCSIAECEHEFIEEHTLVYVEQDGNSIQHKVKCVDCNYEKLEDHYYIYTDNGDGHTVTCYYCTYEDSVAHSYVYTDNGDGTHTLICTKGCGFQPTTEEHEKDYFIEIDDEQHADRCKDCKAIYNYESHEYENNKCECGKEQECEHKPVYTDNYDDTHTITCNNGCSHNVRELHFYIDGVCSCGAKKTYTYVCSSNKSHVYTITIVRTKFSGASVYNFNYTNEKRGTGTIPSSLGNLYYYESKLPCQHKDCTGKLSKTESICTHTNKNIVNYKDISSSNCHEKTCSECRETFLENHNMQNGTCRGCEYHVCVPTQAVDLGNGSHQVGCHYCDKVIIENHSAGGASYYTKDAYGHTGTCGASVNVDGCGVVFTSEHTFYNNTCTTCQYVKCTHIDINNLPSSDYSGWVRSDENHKLLCVTCGNNKIIIKETPHIYDNDADNICNDCGFNRGVCEHTNLDANGLCICGVYAISTVAQYNKAVTPSGDDSGIRNIIFKSNITLSSTYTIGLDVIIDLNGNELSISADQKIGKAKNVTIKNGKISGKRCFSLLEDSELAVDNVTVQITNYNVFTAGKNSTINIKSSTITTTSSAVISGLQNINVEINITSSSLSSKTSLGFGTAGVSGSATVYVDSSSTYNNETISITHFNVGGVVTIKN